MTQLGSPATESDPSDDGRQAVRGTRLTRRRRALFWVAGGAALLAIGGLIGSHRGVPAREPPLARP